MHLPASVQPTALVVALVKAFATARVTDLREANGGVLLSHGSDIAFDSTAYGRLLPQAPGATPKPPGRHAAYA